VRFGAPRSLPKWPESKAFWFALGRLAVGAFARAVVATSSCHRPLPFPAGSSSHEPCRPLRSAFALRPPRVVPACGLSARDQSRSSSRGVPHPLRSATDPTVDCPGFPDPVRSPSAAFLPPTTASVFSACGFVSPRSHVQGSLSRELSPVAEPHRLSPTVALVPLRILACFPDPGFPLFRAAPALMPSTSGPCSPQRVRCARRRFRSPRVRVPPELFLPRVPFPAP